MKFWISGWILSPICQQQLTTKNCHSAFLSTKVDGFIRILAFFSKTSHKNYGTTCAEQIVSGENEKSIKK
jgi:hypothetical protein